MNAQVTNESAKKLPTTPDELVKLGQTLGSVTQSIGAVLDSIRSHSERLVEFKNAADQKSGEQTGLWSDVAKVSRAVAEAAQAAGMGAWAGYIFEMAVQPVMPRDDDEGKRAATVKSYLSTGKSAVVNLLLPGKLDAGKLETMTYSEVRQAIKPPANPGADAARDDLRKMIAFIAKHGDKFGNDADNNAQSRLSAIRAAVEPHYNAVKSAKDAKASAAKAAKELADNRQNAPSEAGTVETSQTADKPEAQGRRAA